MNKIITSIILLGLSVALIIGCVIPVCNQIKASGQISFDVVKKMNDNIKVNP